MKIPATHISIHAINLVCKVSRKRTLFKLATAFLLVFICKNALFGQVDKNVQKRQTLSFECRCPSINLKIYNGLNGATGGQLIDDDEEYKLGAATVANLNDTDGDNIIDAGDNSVLATPNGRNEVDLMRLDIEMKGSPDPACGQFVELIVESGAITFWKTPNKVEPLPDLIFDISEFPATVFIEATTWSNEIGDIVLNVQYNDRVQDIVKATAVWVASERKFAVRGNNNDGTIVPDGLPINPNPYFEFNFGYMNTTLRNIIQKYRSNDNSRYGFGSFLTPSTNQECELGGRILFEFTPYPKDVKLNDLNLSFDIGRRRQSNVNHLEYVNLNLIPHGDNTSWPEQFEASNDDYNNNDTDEDNKIEPDSKDFYSYDAPGYPNALCRNSQYAYYFYSSDFKEYARVGFMNGTNNPFGNGIDAVVGSRCSEDIPWNVNFSMKSVSRSLAEPFLYTNMGLELITTNPSVNAPIISLGTGTGNGLVNVQPLSTATTSECRMKRDGNEWKLWINGNFSSTSNTSTVGPWVINAPGQCTITITNGTTPFTDGIVLLFTIYNSPNPINNSLICD
jgi:hypothetical protein